MDIQIVFIHIVELLSALKRNKLDTCRKMFESQEHYAALKKLATKADMVLFT